MGDTPITAMDLGLKKKLISCFFLSIEVFKLYYMLPDFYTFHFTQKRV